MRFEEIFTVLITACVGCVAYAIGYANGLKRVKESNRWHHTHLGYYRDGYARLSELANGYKRLANGLCGRVNNCCYCPFESDKQREKCKLGKLNDQSRKYHLWERIVGL